VWTTKSERERAIQQGENKEERGRRRMDGEKEDKNARVLK